MKKKMLLILLAVALSVATIAAATMAWFTDEDTAGEAIFTAGTVDVEVVDEFENPVNGNWNPGDTDDVSWKITNTGSKAIVFKVEPEAKWQSADNASADLALGLDNITLKFKIGDKIIDPRNPENGNVYPWHVVGNGNDINDYTIYYIGEPLSGDFGDATAGSINLDLQVLIDGPNTDNDYQGATFTLGGTVEAVQASNGAPNDLWDVDFYEYLDAEILTRGYFNTREQYKGYITNKTDGKVTLSLKELTATNGFSVINGGTLVPEFNYSTSSSGKYSAAYVPVLIDIEKFGGNTIDELVVNGVSRNITASTFSVSDVDGTLKPYLFINIKVAQNKNAPEAGATLADWERSPETQNTVFIHLADDSVYKLEIEYDHL